jgi:hypothetical protein
MCIGKPVLIVSINSSAHWYSKTGESMHEINGKKTTLREARKYNLLPSVTSILKIISNEGLDRWKREQLVMSALTLPRIENESELDYAKRIVTDSEEQGINSAQTGTDIHDAIEQYIKTGKINSVYEKHVRSFIEWNKKEWESEIRVVASDYAGTIDLVSDMHIADIKTQEFKKGKASFYDSWAWQLAAYGLAYWKENWNAKNIIHESIVIDRITGEIQTKIWSEKDIQDAIQVFLLAKQIWKLTKNYYPEILLTDK